MTTSMRILAKLSLVLAFLLGLGLTACDDGGITNCKDWVAEVDACGGWLGVDDPWCDSFRLEVDDGCDCHNVIDWYRESSACVDFEYGPVDGTNLADLPTCACPTGPVNINFQSF